MANDDHSLLLLDFLDTIEIHSHRVGKGASLRRVEWEKVSWAFRLSKHATLHILSEARKITQSTNNCI